MRGPISLVGLVALAPITTWRVMAYEEERGIEEKPGLFRGRSCCPLQRSLAFASGAGLQKKLSRPPGHHTSMRFASSLDFKLVDIAIQLRQQVERDTEVDNGGGRSFRTPGFSLWCGVCPRLLPTPPVGLPDVSRDCRHGGCLHAGLSGLDNSMILHEKIYVV